MIEAVIFDIDGTLVDSDRVIAVGDTPYDAEAATKLGLRVIGVRCGGFSKQELLAAGCQALFRDPEDLLKRYEQWMKD